MKTPHCSLHSTDGFVGNLVLHTANRKLGSVVIGNGCLSNTHEKSVLPGMALHFHCVRGDVGCVVVKGGLVVVVVVVVGGGIEGGGTLLSPGTVNDND